MVKLYVNGKLVDSQAENRTPVDSETPLLIGKVSFKQGSVFCTVGDYSYLDGLMDEIAIFNRALSAAEIKAIYDAGSAGMIKP
jgi:hypothetical protein